MTFLPQIELELGVVAIDVPGLREHGLRLEVLVQRRHQTRSRASQEVSTDTGVNRCGSRRSRSAVTAWRQVPPERGAPAGVVVGAVAADVALTAPDVELASGVDADVAAAEADPLVGAVDVAACAAVGAAAGAAVGNAGAEGAHAASTPTAADDSKPSSAVRRVS